MDLNVLANFLEAFGTISAVVVALVTQVYLVRRRRPHLTMTVSERPEDEDILVVKSPTGDIVELWIRARVLAAERRRTAVGAQVRLTKVVRSANDLNRQIVPSGPMIWSSVGAEPQSILPGMWLRVDILRYRIRDPEFGKPA
jgi:hypothetical protein